MKALTVDVIEQLQKAAGIVGSESAEEEEKISALDTILNYVDDIDTANDFCKIGGLFVLSPCLDSSFTEIRNKAALLIAELAQNNPYCQKELLESGILTKLMNLLSENDTVVAGLRAVSCLVRSNEQCLNAFLKIGGVECLLGCLQQAHNEKLITRAAFFLNSLCADNPDIRNELLKLKAVEMIIPLIQPKTEYDICLETVLSVLCSVVENPRAFENSSYSDFGATLEQIIKLVGGKPECKETVEYSQTLLKHMSNAKQQNEITDR